MLSEGDETRGQEAHCEMGKMSLNRGEKRDTQTLIQSPEHGYEEWIIVRLNLQAQSVKFLAWGHPP